MSRPTAMMEATRRILYVSLSTGNYTEAGAALIES